jgi:hypothetical protein
VQSNPRLYYAVSRRVHAGTFHEGSLTYSTSDGDRNVTNRRHHNPKPVSRAPWTEPRLIRNVTPRRAASFDIRHDSALDKLLFSSYCRSTSACCDYTQRGSLLPGVTPARARVCPEKLDCSVIHKKNKYLSADMSTEAGRSRRTIRPPKRLYESDDEGHSAGAHASQKKAVHCMKVAQPEKRCSSATAVLPRVASARTSAVPPRRRAVPTVLLFS